MNDSIETDLRDELTTLRQRLDKLEAEHREVQAQASRARRPALSRNFGLLVIVLTLAAVGVLWGQQAMSLFINSKGNVGIGTTSPSANLQVGPGNFGEITTLGVTQRNTDTVGLSVRSGAAQAAAVQQFCISDQCSYSQMKKENEKYRIGFADTDGTWLLYSESKIGGNTPNAYVPSNLTVGGNENVAGLLTVDSLKVNKGPLQGKLSHQRFTVELQPSQQSGSGNVTYMTPSANSECFLTSIQGAFTSQSDSVEVKPHPKGVWILYAFQGGANRPGMKVTATCIGPLD
jgi:hypothetical protein